VNKHATTLVECFNQARTIIYDTSANIGMKNWTALSRLLSRLQVNQLSTKKIYIKNLNSNNIKYSVDTWNRRRSEPTGLERQESSESEVEEKTNLEETDLHDLTIPAVLTTPKTQEEDTDDSDIA